MGGGGGAWEVEHRWSLGGGGGEKKEPLFQMKHTFSLFGNSGDVEHANDDGATRVNPIQVTSY